MIQSVLLVALGFLAASLLVLFVAPAFYARAVRLTTERIKRSLPVSEAEIRADKDRLRAQYAVRVHQLEKEIENARLGAARRLIELNRRDADLVEFDDKVQRLQAELEENQNARRVLEQTINDRLPKLEGRLEQARQLIRQRDQHIEKLTNAAQVMDDALDEARGINAQLQADNDRLRDALSMNQSRDRLASADADGGALRAMRNELGALRAQTRDQTALIARLRRDLAQAGGIAGTQEAGGMLGASGPGAEGQPEAAGLNGRGASSTGQPVLQALATSTGERSAEDVAALEAALAERDEAIKGLKVTVATLEAERAGSERGVDPRESKASLQGKVDGLQVRLDAAENQNARLKAELAAANDRAAREAARYMSEMRRLGGEGRPLGRRAVQAATSVERRKEANERHRAAMAASEPRRRMAAVQPTAESGASAAPMVVAASGGSAGGSAQVASGSTTGEAAERRDAQATGRSNKLLERLRSYE